MDRQQNCQQIIKTTKHEILLIYLNQIQAFQLKQKYIAYQIKTMP